LALAQFHVNLADLQLAEELGEKVLHIAQETGPATMLAGAHFVLGLVWFARGQFIEVRDHEERAIELFGVVAPGSLSALLSAFSRIAHNMLIGALCILGYPTIALTRAQELLAVARQSSDPTLIGNALSAELLRRVSLRDFTQPAQATDELLSIAAEHGMPFFLAMANFFRGWARACALCDPQGIAEMRRSIAGGTIVRASATALLLLVILAETSGKSGNTQEGLDLVAEGLTTAQQTGMRIYEAELHRLRGELLMIKDPGNIVEAERCLRTAIEVARQQSARLFELRATVSLARLLRDTDQRDEARAMLSDIYNWFTEGFDTPDLKDAQALLDDLSA
jgi:predicted ATPase